MTETDEIPQQFTTGGHTWKYFTYDGGNRHQWYRSMTDDEVRENTNGRIDGVDDIDFHMMWPVADYPVYMIELHHVPSSGECTVTGNRTYLGAPRPGQTDSLGPNYRMETADISEAVLTVHKYAKSLS